ncbi:serine hydrolase [Actinomadura sp. NEAU-AAG7]|uniref:serine hydrolase domain-containing protein n=1 Tax=Actinomadura sp. NEAU-AAG7 TaxID=2839640 RepID=UPI001BE43038|nr:serine hydrolase domain-containing protein [Actinomadura sp. NEAU-AAG7]MBT2211947.1 beta-lactamase family protein [Actinomadura sp. NEAU-AAG7]
MTRHRRALGGALTLAAAAATATALTVHHTPGRAAAAATPATPSNPSGGADHGRLREILRRLTTRDGAPGALLQYRDRTGDTVLTGGDADITRHTPMRPDSRFRIGSMTKPFIATVVLQLAGEHRLALDAPVERYLPGVVRGHGNDGRVITVRQLLQHTSGVPDYLTYLSPLDILKDPTAHHDTRDLVNLALAHPPTFAPGTGWRYSNTGYLLTGMLIERVTGHTYAEEIHHRVITPLDLDGTSVPGDSPQIPGPHPRGYARPGEDAPLLDTTAVNPSAAGAAGEMISTGTDINRFFDALVRGALLRPAQLREMTRTRPTGHPDGVAYGLGLESRPLPCGGLYWGHTGDMLGFETMGGATRDGAQATVMVNLGPGGPDAQSADMKAAIETALCPPRPTTAR